MFVLFVSQLFDDLMATERELIFISPGGGYGLPAFDGHILFLGQCLARCASAKGRKNVAVAFLEYSKGPHHLIIFSAFGKSSIADEKLHASPPRPNSLANFCKLRKLYVSSYRVTTNHQRYSIIAETALSPLKERDTDRS